MHGRSDESLEDPIYHQTMRGRMSKRRKLKQIDVKMDHVEGRSPPPNLFQHHEQAGSVIAHTSKPQALRNCSHQFSRRLGVSASEKRNIMTLLDEFFSQPGDDTFSAAIELGRNGFRQGCDLCNTHWISLCYAKRQSSTRFRRNRRHPLTRALLVHRNSEELDMGTKNGFG